MEEQGKKTMGFSDIANNQAFRKEMKKQQGRNFKRILLMIPLIFVVVVIISLVAAKMKGYGIEVAVGADTFVFILMVIIAIVNLAMHLKKISDLKKSSIDGVIESKERYGADQHSNGRGIRYTVVVRTDDGKKIKLKQPIAGPYYYHTEKGDKVRYHPGFVYPIEMYDKSKDNVNICVFCGKESEASADKCSVCGKQMLV